MVWIGDTRIDSFEKLSRFFVAFADMEENHAYLKSGYYNNIPENFAMSSEVSQWCRDNHIKYRKTRTYSMMIETTSEICHYGLSCGLLFYREEDAMAFKLQWT